MGSRTRELLTILHELGQLLGHQVPIYRAIGRRANQEVTAASPRTHRVCWLDAALPVRRVLIAAQLVKVLSILSDQAPDRDSIDLDRALHNVLHHVLVLACAVAVDQKDAIRLCIALKYYAWLALVLLDHLTELLGCQLELFA